MKFLSKLIVVLFVISLSACASKKGSFVTEHDDAWVDGLERGLLYCRSNKEIDGLANPVCFETRFEEYEDEKKKVEKTKERERRIKENN